MLRVSDQEVIPHRDVVDRPEVVLDEDIGRVPAYDGVVLDQNVILSALSGDAVIVRIAKIVVQVVNIIVLHHTRAIQQADPVFAVADVIADERA